MISGMISATALYVRILPLLEIVLPELEFALSPKRKLGRRTMPTCLILRERPNISAESLGLRLSCWPAIRMGKMAANSRCWTLMMYALQRPKSRMLQAMIPDTGLRC